MVYFALNGALDCKLNVSVPTTFGRIMMCLGARARYLALSMLVHVHVKPHTLIEAIKTTVINQVLEACFVLFLFRQFFLSPPSSSSLFRSTFALAFAVINGDAVPAYVVG